MQLMWTLQKTFVSATKNSRKKGTPILDLTHMDCSTVDIHFHSEAFGGTRMEYFDIKPTDGANVCSYLRKFWIN